MRSIGGRALEAVVALGLGYLVWLVFGVDATAQSDPPICANAFGRTVSCSHAGPAKVAGIVVAIVCWWLLLWVHALVGRRRANVDRVLTS
jgi:hypothetical protein